MLAALLLPFFAAIAAAQAVIYSATNSKATAYYDLANTDKCLWQNGGPFSPGWYNTINGGYTACQDSGDTRYTLNSLGSNRIVAMDLDMYGKGRDYWCGKEVQIFDASGKQIILDEGPFVLYDHCGACEAGGIIDVSAKAFVQIKGNTCGGDNPTGLTVKILDRKVSPSGKPGGGGGYIPAPTTTATMTRSTTTPTTTTSSRTSTTTRTFTTSTTTTSSKTSATTRTSTTTTKVWWTPITTAMATSITPKTSTTSTRASTTTAPLVRPVMPTKSSTTITRTTASGPSRLTDQAVALAPASCEISKWKCEGLVLKICNYVTWNQLGWETVAECPNECSFSSTNALICR